ncbi:Sodium-dependent low-affinity dicarboxylate transporter 1 [Folsomia candida]|uniref:Sodium-dependent low-affinity dicarboxylate transporter 1 n=1 Tax=Folsomia candida TaxID=158441 RepID=A0A226EST8_FOLCA|nr:Sodium-dependent low-affinity dicarboxylate transporter 1 [Folsomia candida]
MSLKSLQIRILRNWEFFVIIGLPLLLLPLLFIPDDEVIGVAPNTRPSTKFKCAFVLILMAIYWMVEALPLAITALLPMVLFPLLGVQDTAKVSINYMKETNMMFVGGLIIAMAVEYCNLHRRIALTVMTTVGVSPIRLMCGIMLTTSFLSMWLSNTATAAMVCPISMAVLEELFPKPDETPHGFRKRRASIFKERSEVDFEAFVDKIKKKRAQLKHQQSLPAESFRTEPRPPKKMMKQLSFKIDPEPLEPSELTRFIRERDRQKDIQFEMQMEEQNENEDEHEENNDAENNPEKIRMAKRLNLKKMLLFSILLSSNIGGTGVITGTASNLVFQELIKPVNVGQGGKYVDISFATWMAYNIPPMMVNIAFSFIYLVVMYLGVPDWVYFWRKQKSTPNSDETEALNRVARVLEEKRRLLGKTSFHESAVFALFLIIVALWLFREPKFMKGWAEHISDADIGDSTAALFVVILLFIIPRNIETFCGVGDNNGGAVLTKTPPLLDWKYVQLNLPWVSL